jgi:radical SAM superfamily enzyme YgiQ (UPF0313 family)
MKVLFIYPNINSQVGFNFGLAFVSAMLKANGHHTRLLNLNEKLNRLPTDEEIRAFVEDFKPGLIGISAVTPQYRSAVKIARHIKCFSKTPVVLGGVHATLVPEEVLKEDCFDYACVGEGEEAVLELAERLEKGQDTTNIANIWTKKAGKVIPNNVRPFVDLSKLPRKDYPLFNMQKLIDTEDGWVRLMTSRGCPFRCTYCFNHKIVDRYRQETGTPTSELGYIRQHPLGEVFGEMEYLQSNYQRIKMFIFDDDVFTLDKTYLREFCQQYRKVTQLPFVVNAHVRAFDEERARMLKEAGCAIVKFGLESGSERIRREVLHRPMTNKEIGRAFELAHKYGLHTSAFIMIGLPYEGKEEVMETVELLARIRPGRFRWSVFYPFPRTEAYELSLKGGYVDFEKMQALQNFTEASCLNFGEEHNLFISKLQRTFPWFVNRYSSNSVATLYTTLTRAIEEMSEEAWQNFGGKVSDMDKEISTLLKKAHCEHYAFRYNPFTAVRSDWEG